MRALETILEMVWACAEGDSGWKTKDDEYRGRGRVRGTQVICCGDPRRR